MAVDTAEKRRSAAGIPFLPLGPGVTPNASKDQEWRQQSGWGYSGLLAEEASNIPHICVGTISITLPSANSVSIALPSANNVSIEDCE